MTVTETGEPRVVVGVDGSEESERALRWGAWLAGRLGGARIDAVMVWQAPVALEYNMTTSIGDWDPQADCEKTLEATIDKVFGPERPRELHAVATEGNPARRLVDLSRGATTLVVGNRGRGGFASLMLGSVSVRCVEYASCPVLVVRNDEPPTLVPVAAADRSVD